MGPLRHQVRGLNRSDPASSTDRTGAAVLPDVLPPGLAIVFCGSAASAASARRGAYYAGPGNKFWRTLHEVGLTPDLLTPDAFHRLPEFGIGLTDMAKHASGGDASLPPGADDPAGLRERIEACAPRILAFNGKRAARVALAAWFGARDIDYGAQHHRLQNSAIHVLPSTSGAANGFWSIEPWRALARAAGTG